MRSTTHLDARGRSFAKAVLLSCVVAAIACHGSAALAQEHAGPGGIWQLPRVAPAPASNRTRAVRTCESLSNSHPSRTAVIREARVMPQGNGEREWCRVTIEIAPDAASAAMLVWLALPSEWNGRFLGLGGGGWMPGFPDALDAGARLGFATAITNAGRPYDLSTPAETLRDLVGRNDFLRAADGHLDWNALENFAYRGIHEMTVLGKSVTTDFYGHAPRYDYFSGCSTGGRQGQAEVQRYPDDYDGVVSGSPAIHWAHFAAAESWVRVVTNELGPVAPCKYEAARRAAVAACDSRDGVRDGFASIGCDFDARSLVGSHTDCGTFDAHDADVIRRIWDGPRRRDGSRLWSGVDPTALIHAPPPLDAARARASPFSEASAGPLVPSMAEFEDEFDAFVDRYGPVMDTSDPDLSAFADGGGKTIIWHGVADDVIPVAGTVHYVDAIRRTLGAEKTNSFLRFYLAPGVGHCGGGEGPHPVALLDALMEWVEQGRPPTLGRRFPSL
jgi:feruloyl esterase